MAQISIELKSLWKRENINALKFMHYSRKYSAHSHFGPVRGWVGLSAGRLAKFIGAVWNRTHKNVEVYGRSEDETPRKCILQAENIMPGSKKLWEEHLFPSEKTVFLPSVEKTTIFSSGNKSSPQSFSVPGIMFPPRRNIYSFSFQNKSLNPRRKLFELFPSMAP